MRRSASFVIAGVLALSVLLSPSRANAGTIFNVVFDNTFDLGALPTPPFVGSGTVSVDDTLTDGSYLISSLTNLQILFTIGPESWTQADMFTDPTSSIVVYGLAHGFYFEGPGLTTPGFGAVDFVNANFELLTTEPTYFFGSAPYTLYFTSTNSGNYGPIPEPSSIALTFSGGLVGLIALARHRARSIRRRA